jgi:hypothetical protein
MRNPDDNQDNKKEKDKVKYKNPQPSQTIPDATNNVSHTLYCFTRLKDRILAQLK